MEISNNNIAQIFNKFKHNSEFYSYSELTSGHINNTYLIKTSKDDNFILQRINKYVFENGKDLILNKVLVSEHIQSKLKNLSKTELSKRVLRFVKTKSNLPYYCDSEGNYWNMTFFIKGSKTFERVENQEIAYEGGKLIGDFLNLTEGIDINKISEIIPNFHEMSFRFEQFYEAQNKSSEKRLNLAQSCISFADSLKEEMHILENLKNSRKIPLRLTHNDSKISNVLFDKNNKGLCVIDTDTVMIGIIHYDFGDAVRTICNTANEDEKDLSKVNFNIEYYNAFTRGFFTEMHNQLTIFDVKYLVLAAKTITFIMGLRMLTDFLNNDIYYKTSYDLHNLDRAKNQFKLADSIQNNFKTLNEITLMNFNKLK